MSFSYRSDHDEEPNYSYNITGVALSNRTIIFISTLGFGALGFVFYFLILRRLSQDGHDDGHEHVDHGRDDYGELLDQTTDVATLNRAQRRARAKFRMKKARRAALPGAADGIGGNAGGAVQGVIGEEGNDVREDGGRVDNNLAETNLSRKERQRAAKAMEKEERKVYAKEAKLWREKTQSTAKSGASNGDKGKNDEATNEQKERPIEELFPQREQEDDEMSECLFRESICRSISQRARSYDETVSMIRNTPRMTTYEFIERLKENGSVSIAALAKEFGISVPETVAGLEHMNKEHGVVGIADSRGNFIYVSMQMIEEVIRLGKEAGRVGTMS